MTFYKAFVRKNNDVWDAKVVEFKTYDIMDNDSPNMRVVDKKEDFPSYILAFAWAMNRKLLFEEHGDVSGWQEVK